MMLRRLPGPPLRPFVAVLWASDGADEGGGAAVERVLPTGAMHVVLRLAATPLRILASPDDAQGRAIAGGVVGGARASAYLRDVSRPAPTVGAQLHPGAAELLLGVPVDELAERHTPLADLWGRASDEACARLLEIPSPAARLDAFEQMLAARLPRVRGLHPAIAEALARLGEAEVGEIVRSSGYSHRRFLTLFRRAVGLSPKVFWRVRRLQRALARLAAAPGTSLVDLSLESGYSDQPHFQRDFRELTGLTPGEYRAIAPPASHHVPLRARAARR